jgi:integrase
MTTQSAAPDDQPKGSNGENGSTVLTAASVERYKPMKTRREIRDLRAPGLYLIVQPKPSGAKSWAMRFRRPDGKPAKLTLGPVDLSDNEAADEPTLGGALTLRQARELANQIDRKRARGIDVVAQYKADKTRHRIAAAEKAANTFGAAAREFFIDYKTKHKERPRRWRGDARLLGLKWPRDCDPAKVEPEVMPGSLAATWADKPVTDIDGHDIHAVVDDARRRGVPGLKSRNKDTSEARGRKLHAALSVLFRYLQRHRRVVNNPCVGVWRPGAPPARDRVLSDAEVKVFWNAADKMPLYGPLLKILLLTGCRLNEVVGMRGEELTEHGAVWVIPKERTKNHRPHTLPLPKLARDIIASVPAVEGGYIFSLSGKPLSTFSKMKAALDEAMGHVPPWRLHDLRRTAASGMQRLGVRVEIVERALNHISGSFRGVAGTYQRDPLTNDVRDALERWARHIAGLASPEQTEKIVSLSKRKRIE